MIRLSDVRYAFRLWRRHPAMVIVAGLSLGLGVGATTTMYGVVNRVSNYQLGFAEADRLAVLWTNNAEKGIHQQPPNWEIVQAVLEHGHSFESFGFFQGFGAPVTLSTTTEATRVSQMPVDVNALVDRRRQAGARPDVSRRGFHWTGSSRRKRVRLSSATTPGSSGSAAPPMSSGTTIHVDGEPRTIIGVMPQGFTLVPWEDDVAFWIANDLRKIPEARWMIAVGRLKPGVSVAAAQAEATVIARQLHRSTRRKAGRHRRRGRPAARRVLWRCDEGADVPARRGELRAADRLRKRREPAARRRNGAPEGAGAARRHRGADAAA